jgi:hypothetical protein
MYGKDYNGVARPSLVDTAGRALTVPCGGKYADAAINGRLFYAANQTPVATSTTLNTTFTGLGLANPTGSGKIIVVHEFGWSIVKPAGDESVLALGTTTWTTNWAQAITAQCCRYGYATSIAYVDDGATIVAPVLVKIIATIGTNLVTDLTQNNCVVDLGGSIVLAPGRAVVTDTTTASGAATIQFSFLWEEVDE